MAVDDILKICQLRGDLGDRVANRDASRGCGGCGGCGGGGGVIEGSRRDEKLREVNPQPLQNLATTPMKVVEKSEPVAHVRTHTPFSQNVFGPESESRESF